jgi:hypothetical protein
MNRKHCSPRHFQPLDGGGQSGAAWGAKRWILVTCWSCCCALLVLLLMTEMQFMPGVHKGAWDTTRAVQTGVISSSGSDGSSNNSTSSGNSSKPVDLSVLWEALPFTPAIKQGSHGHIEYSHSASAYQQMLQQQQQQQQQQQAVGLLQHPVVVAAAESATAELAQTAVLPALPALQHQPLLAPLVQPETANPDHPDIALMASLVAEAVDAGITADEARAGYEHAFATVAPPAGMTWHLRKSTTASSWQQRQQKGAEYVDTDSSSSTTNGGRGLVSMGGSSEDSEDNNLSAADEQQRSLQAQAALAQLMTHALQVLKATGRLADCGTEDDSLPPLLQQSGDASGGAGGPGRVLLAAALHQSEEAMPNTVLQLVLVSDL